MPTMCLETEDALYNHAAAGAWLKRGRVSARDGKGWRKAQIVRAELQLKQGKRKLTSRRPSHKTFPDV